MFDDTFNEILNFLNEDTGGEIAVALKYFDEMSRYTIFEGKQSRGKAVVNTYKRLTETLDDSKKLKQALIVGCCVEILQASFLIHDDIMDKSETRRGKRCWYLIGQEKGFGLISVNDGLYLSTVIHRILKKYFRSEPFYADLVDVFNDAIYRTCAGQCLDMLTSSSTIDWDNFTESRLHAIVKWKTAFYSFKLPIISAMILAGESDVAVFDAAERILLKIGEYFQYQDDYLDFYGDATVMGKIGRDIEDGKCTWLMIQALKLASDDQIIELKKHYGKEDPDSVKVVRNIYIDLQLDQVFYKLEMETYDKVVQMVEELEKGDGKKLPRAIFTDLLDQIFKRKK